MTVVGALLSVLLPAVLGVLLLRQLAPALWEAPWRPFTCSLGAGLGLGLTSVSLFLGMVLLGSARPLGLVPEVVAVVALALAAAVARRRAGAVQAAASVQANHTSQVLPVASLALTLVLGVLLLAAVARFLHGAIDRPQGGWDAEAIWNLRARFLFRGGVDWRSAFDARLAFSHPDYPLLLPLNVVRGWLYAGGETPLVPVALAFVFTFGQVGMAGSALRALRGWPQACLASAVLLATPVLVEVGWTQYADVVVGFFILSTLVLFTLADSRPGGSAPLEALAGLTASLAAWSKNEGLLFLVAVLAARACALAVTLGLRPAIRRWVPCALAAVPVVAVVAGFKLGLAPPNELVAAATGPSAMLRQVFNPERLYIIVRKIGAELLKGPLWQHGPLALVAYSLLARGPGLPSERLAKRTNLGTLALMGLGVIFVYLTTPYELKWHLQFSITRVLAQLWPASVFVLFTLLEPPTRWLTRPERPLQAE